MRKSILFFSLAAVVALVSCNNFKKTDTGLEYKIYTDNNGRAIHLGDYVTINMSYKTEKDSVLFDSYKTKQPLRIMVSPPLFKGELMEGLVLLAENDSATFKVNADSLFAKTQNPIFNHPGEKIIFNLKIEKVFTRAELEKQVDSERQSMMSKEKESIDKYLTDNKLNPVATGTGLRYVILKQGTGSIANEGDTVRVKYSGKLLNGFEFDPGREPISFVIGRGEVIKGWDEAFSLLTKGTKAKLIIPSHLAYGERGAGEVIPPFSTLTFEAELLDIKRKKN